MTIVNIFDAAREGDWDAFRKFYSGNINEVDPYSNFSLLQLAVTSTENSEGRLAIIRFLLENGIDLNFRDKKYCRNALHASFFGFRKGDINHLRKQTELLISAGMDVNATGKFDAIPLKYAITISKHPTEEMKEIYVMLLQRFRDKPSISTNVNSRGTKRMFSGPRIASYRLGVDCFLPFFFFGSSVSWFIMVICPSTCATGWRAMPRSLSVAVRIPSP